MNEEFTNGAEFDLNELAQEVQFDGSAPVSESQETEAPACEAPVEEAQPCEAEAPCQCEEVKEPDISLEEYKAALDAHFQNLRALIKYTKTKDETITKLSNELQKYREDYCAKSFKSIASLIISYREDCKKSLDDMGKFELTFEKVKKFMSFLSDDYMEMLSNVGCEEEDVWLFNGKPLFLTEEKEAVKFPKVFELTEEDEAGCDLGPISDVKEYLQNAEECIKATLANNEKLDKCLKDYAKLSTVIEEDVVLLYVVPAVRRLVNLYKSFSEKVNAALEGLNEENMLDEYAACLTYIVDKLEDVLLSGGVMIYTTCDDTVDTRKNRIIKTIVTDDPAMDRKIARKITDCYVVNDVVMYPAKVDVYKYQAPQA